MDIFILDSLYRRVVVIDKYESLIWTERRSAIGDFELHIQSTPKNRTALLAGVMLSIKSSYRVMVIETVQNTSDDQNRKILILKGRSLEKILDDRLARGTLGDLTTTPKWTLTGTPMAIANQIFHDICVTGILDAGDIISGVTESNVLFPDDTITPPTDTITYEIDPMTVYQALKDLCDAYDMGFRLVRDPVSNLLYFDVYMGCNRTARQTTLPAVVFAPNLDNIQNTNAVSTIAAHKNVAYVISAVGHEIVYADGVDTSVAGFERQVLVVNAQDINDSTPSVASAQMIQRGKEELAKNRTFTGLDGQISQYAQYVYMTDYNLGDLVELRDEDGITTDLSVTEQIIVSDKEGERAYPTLSATAFLTIGSWAAWDPVQEWFDLDTGPGLTEYWADQP